MLLAPLIGLTTIDFNHYTVGNFHLNTFVSAGVLRETEEEEKAGYFLVYEDPDQAYSTFEFRYPNMAFDNLTQLMDFNKQFAGDAIKSATAECVVYPRNIQKAAAK